MLGDTARTPRGLKWVPVNTRAHLFFPRQQDSLQKIDWTRRAPGGNPRWRAALGAAGVVAAGAPSELVKVVGSFWNTINTARRTLSSTAKDTVGFNFKPAARDIRQYVL